MLIEIRDQLQRKICLDSVPKRIVSLVPSQTELLCDLGLDTAVVGVTKFCVHPNYIKSKSKIVGGTKQLHIEKIKALNPDIILCNKEENTKEIVAACEQIAPVHISDIYTIDDSLELINQYGVLFQKEKEVLNIITKVMEELQDFQNFMELRVSYKTVYFIWRFPWMIAANNTFINYLMGLNKFENFYKTEARYPEIRLKAEEDVELVLLSSEPYPFKKMHVSELKTFYPNAKIHLVDGEMFSWYGSRLTKAFQYFKLLHGYL